MILVILLYSLAVLVLLSVNEVLLLLFLIEVLSWGFVFLLDKNLSFNYLLVQTLFLLGSLLSIIWFPQQLFLFIFLNIGIPPFHGWFINFSNTLNTTSFLFMVTIHNMIPLLFMCNVLAASSSSIIIGLIILTSGLIIMVSELLTVIVISSIVHSGWLIVSSLISINVLITYFFLYSIALVSIFNTMGMLELSSLSSSQNSNTSGLWLILSGIPPFTFFWLNVLIIINLTNVSLLLALALMLVSVVSIYIYYRIFHFVINPSIFTSSNLVSLVPIYGVFLFF